MATTVEVLADAFQAAGTPFIVGHPGGELVELMEAARQREMRFILMKQEVAGAMLAATWGEITGAPGVCLSTRGPGAANMVNGVAQAFLDRSPLIAITDRYPTPAHEVGLRQRLDQHGIYAPIVKWGATLDARVVRQQVRRALRTASAPPPGPVQLDLPHSETRREADDARGRAAAPAELSAPGPGPRQPAAGAAGDRARLPADPAGWPRRALEPGVGRADGVGRAARRPGADDRQVQGRDPRGPSLARRLHHRRPDRAQAGHAGGPDHHGRPGRGGIAAQAVALRDSRDLARPDPGTRRAGAGPARGDRRSATDPCPPRRVVRRRQ